MPGRSAHRARTALLASGNVNRKRELLRRAELSDQALKGLAQVGDSSLGCITLAVRPHTGTQLRMSTLDTDFVLFRGVGDVHGPGHGSRLIRIGLAILTGMGRWGAGGQTYTKQSSHRLS